MIKSRAKTGAEMRQTGLQGLPFVGPYEPLVGPITPLIRPFVLKKRPFVCIRRECGLTLVELIIALVVAAILLTLAAPNLSGFLKRDRLVTQANDLVADLAFARSEAIKRGAPVIICKSLNPGAADPTCNPTVSAPWTDGRVIFFDLPPGNNEADPGEIIRVRQRLDGADSSKNALHGDDNLNGTGTLITFNGLGMAMDPTGAVLPGDKQLTFCDDRGPANALAVVIGPTGRPRVAEKGKNWNGDPLGAGDCS